MYKIQNSDSGMRWFAITINSHSDSQSTLSFYINDYSLIPVGKVVYDFFNSGELFINLSPTTKIVNANDSMLTIYTNYVLPNNASAFIKSPEYSGVIPNWVERYSDQKLNGWMFDASLLFKLKMDLSSIPVCKSFSGITTSSSKIVISPDYHFGNQNTTINICSNPKVYKDRLTPHACPFNDSTSEFSSCPFYQYDYEVIKSVSVDQNSLGHKIFELRKVTTLSETTLYQIFDVNQNQINYVFQDKDHEDFAQHALNILDEIVSSYKTSEDITHISKSNIFNAKDSPSYILSLV